MVKAIVLVLLFSDGYLGGRTTAAHFYTAERCQEVGARLALQFTGYGHPTSYFCAPTEIPEANKRIIRK